MMALFWYSPVPWWMTKNRDGQPGFLLSGDTHEEICWDLVEQFFDGFMTNDVFGPSAMANLVADESDFSPSLAKSGQYHVRRFTDEWWREQDERLQYYGRTKANPLEWVPYDTRDSDELLAFYLANMVQAFYLQHHENLTFDDYSPKGVLDYFERNTYLKWIDLKDRKLVSQVAAGNLRALW